MLIQLSYDVIIRGRNETRVFSARALVTLTHKMAGPTLYAAHDQSSIANQLAS